MGRDLPEETWRARAWRAAFALAALAAVAWGLILAGVVDLPGRAQKAVAEAGAQNGLVVRDVVVTGRVRTAPEDLLAAVGAARGDPLLAFDPAEAQARIRALPWVAEARVERRADGVIAVVLAERVAVARWAEVPGAAPVLIDAGGQTITQADARFDRLPLLMGPGAPGEADNTILALLAAEPAAARRTAYAERVSRRRWDLVLDNGARILLPTDDPAPALARVMALQGRERILDTPGARVDARREGEVIIGGGGEEAVAPGGIEQTTRD